MRQVMLEKILERRHNLPATTGERQNPLRFAAAVSVVSIVWEAYRLIYYHRIAWNEAVAIVLAGAFLMAYVRHWRIAWLIALAIFAGLLPVNLIIYYITSSASPYSQIGTGFMIAFWVGCMTYILWARSRYFDYIRECN
jgi:hypothetical protein